MVGAPGRWTYRIETAFFYSMPPLRSRRFSWSASLLAGWVALAGCTADLRTDALRSAAVSAENQTQARAAFDAMLQEHGYAAWRKASRAEWVVVDEWSSSFLRGFTPLPANRCRLTIQLTPGKSQLEARIVALPDDAENDGSNQRATETETESASNETASQAGAGETLVLGLDDGRPYRLKTLQSGDGAQGGAGGERMYLEGGEADEARIYLESLQLYFELPFRLADARALALLSDAAEAPSNNAVPSSEVDQGWKKIRVYAARQDFALDPQRDQYIFAIDGAARRVQHAAFTYRELFAFYSGALLYRDLKRFDGVLLPRRIDVTGGPEDSEADHSFLLESARFVR